MCSNLSLRSYGNVNNINVRCVCVCVWFLPNERRKICSTWNVRQKNHQTLVKRFTFVIVVVVDVEQLNYETSLWIGKKTSREAKRLIIIWITKIWFTNMLSTFDYHPCYAHFILLKYSMFECWHYIYVLCVHFSFFGPAAYGQIQIRLICSHPSSSVHRPLY